MGYNLSTKLAQLLGKYVIIRPMRSSPKNIPAEIVGRGLPLRRSAARRVHLSRQLQQED